MRKTKKVRKTVEKVVSVHCDKCNRIIPDNHYFSITDYYFGYHSPSDCTRFSLDLCDYCLAYIVADIPGARFHTTVLSKKPSRKDFLNDLRNYRNQRLIGIIFLGERIKKNKIYYFKGV